MLQCTQTAADTLSDVRRQQGIPESFGLRVFPADSGAGQVDLRLGFSDGPAEGDQVAEAHGERLFVAPEVADALSGMALDVVPGPAADAASPQLVLRRAEPET